MMRKSKFVHDAEVDGYRCPEGQLLTYATTDRNGYRHYTSDPAICRDCPLLASCTTNGKAVRTITRHVWADARERTDANRLKPWGKAVYKRRKETVERMRAAKAVCLELVISSKSMAYVMRYSDFPH
ncbi:hypothetical protein GGQ67_005078 [Rhizobium metallidurans]|uniref:Transposase DDE domain-containing protein n=1 Tax=Rhizobium metallidurans TaxID=1265931 RepID=A0A7W6CUG9_9HYPH|nr:hypothetical protein [Rhizobium metallidurans]